MEARLEVVTTLQCANMLNSDAAHLKYFFKRRRAAFPNASPPPAAGLRRVDGAVSKLRPKPPAEDGDRMEQGGGGAEKGDSFSWRRPAALPKASPGSWKKLIDWAAAQVALVDPLSHRVSCVERTAREDQSSEPRKPGKATPSRRLQNKNPNALPPHSKEENRESPSGDLSSRDCFGPLFLSGIKFI